jgi:hypothetical protein
LNRHSFREPRDFRTSYGLRRRAPGRLWSGLFRHPKSGSSFLCRSSQTSIILPSAVFMVSPVLTSHFETVEDHGEAGPTVSFDGERLPIGVVGGVVDTESSRLGGPFDFIRGYAHKAQHVSGHCCNV